jgi:acetylglutamate kinase
VELLYAFEKNGVLRDVNDDHSVIASINSASYQVLKDTGVISEGMLPKMENCFEALQKGVAKVLLGNPTLLRNKEQPFTTLTL